MSPKRQTIATYGATGLRVRVLVDAARGRVLAEWFEKGKARKKVFASNANGKREAKAWAEAFAGERAHLDSDRPDTLRGIWDAYREARWDDLRPRTRTLYSERWRQWELFVGAETDPEGITLHDVDKFRARRRALKQSGNQTRLILSVAKIVFAWAKSRKLLLVNDLASYRWKAAKGEAALEIDEHSPADVAAIIAALDPKKAGEWRLWCLLKIAGTQGARIRSARYLRWSDVGAACMTWPAEYMKQGEDFEQPITEAVREALKVAAEWRERMGYTGEWVFFAARVKNKEPVYTYQSAWIQFRKAEKRAGVAHVKYRAFHGFRRHAAGNAYDATKDQLAAAEWIGDKDVKQMRSYLKRRGERLADVAARLEEQKP